MFHPGESWKNKFLKIRCICFCAVSYFSKSLEVSLLGKEKDEIQMFNISLSGIWAFSMTNNQLRLLFLPYRQAWALVGVIDGGSSSCNESVRNYENHSTGGKALAQGEFYTLDGQKFSVTAYSEWVQGRQRSFTFCDTLLGGVTLSRHQSACLSGFVS